MTDHHDNSNGIPNWLLLPKDIWTNIIADWLGTVRDVGACTQVCVYWRDVAMDEQQRVWRTLANLQYGADLVSATIALYDGSYRALMRDENRRGALPSIYGLWKCEYLWNRDDYYFCCLVTCLQWDRMAGQVRLYLDARGEFDLRYPGTTRMWSDFYTEPTEARCVFTSLIAAEDERPGHYKGYLTFGERFFRLPCRYMFCYANRVRGHRDYQDVELFAMNLGENILKAWAKCPGFQYTLRSEPSTTSPFTHDTAEVERQRWKPHVREGVWSRPGPVWWV